MQEIAKADKQMLSGEHHVCSLRTLGQHESVPDLSASLLEMVDDGLAQLFWRETIQESHFAAMSLLHSSTSRL